MTSMVGAGIDISDKEELSCVNCCSYESSFCAAASCVKSITGGCEVMALSSIRERASATGLLCPLMCWMSVVNCEI